MLTFTEAARATVRSFMAQDYVESPVLRIMVLDGSSPLSPEYDFSLVEEWEQDDDDLVVDAGDFTVLLDMESAARIDGAVIDYVASDGPARFEVRLGGAQAATPDSPRGAPVSEAESELARRIVALLEERVNPAIAAHGGRISLAAVEGTVVYLEMSGGCQGCGMARVTLRQGVERMVRDAIPEVSEIRDVTDHMAGSNPYYRAD
jgi:Fe/S biogenesis protein NfuA